MHPGRKWIVEYGITWLFEELEHVNLLDRTDKNDLFSLFANQCGLLGLLPRALQPAEKGDTMSAVVTPNHQGLLIHCQAGTVPPKDILEAAAKDFPNCYVSVVADGGKVEFLTQDNATPSIETILSEFDMGVECALYMGKAETGYNDDSLPPMDLVTNDAGDVLISCLLEGDLPNFYHEESRNSREFFAVHESILDEVRAIFDQNSGDLDKVFTILDSAVVRKRFVNAILKPRGSMILIGGNGKFLSYHANDSISTGEANKWWMSRKPIDHDATTATVEDKPMSARERMAARRAAANAKAGSKSEDDKKAPVTAATVAQTKEKTETADTSNLTSMAREILVPKHLMGKNDLVRKSQWIRDNLILKTDKEGKVIMPERWEVAQAYPANMFKPGSPMLQLNKDLSKINDLAKQTAKVVEAEVPTLIHTQQIKEFKAKILDRLDNDYLWSMEDIEKDAKDAPDWGQLQEKDAAGHVTFDYPFIKTLFWPTKGYKPMQFSMGMVGTTWANEARHLLFKYAGKQLQEELRKVLEKEANDLKAKSGKATKAA